MELARLQKLLEDERGAVLIALDAETKPSPGFRKLVKQEVSLIFMNYGRSGYEELVKQQLIHAGKEPGNFAMRDLPFGVRVGESPIIEHKGKYYLQTILIKEGETETFIGNSKCKPSDFPDVFMRRSERYTALAQGLVPETAVRVRTYALENIQEVRLQHKSVAA